MVRFLFYILVLISLFSCQPVNSFIQKEKKEYSKKVTYKHTYCIKEIKMEKPLETAIDLFTRYISKAILSSGNALGCSSKTDRYISLYVKSLYIYSIGYSLSQRATIYKVNVNMDVSIENRKNEPILKRNITELTQYVGSGLRADTERRYALEELAKLIEMRIYSLLLEVQSTTSK